MVRSLKVELLFLTHCADVGSGCRRRHTIRQKTRVGTHIKVPEVVEWGCRCIRRRLIIICTKYFVIVNYGAATDFRGQDQALSERGGRYKRAMEPFHVLLSQSSAPVRSRVRAHFDRDGILRLFRSITVEQTLIHHFSFS